MQEPSSGRTVGAHPPRPPLPRAAMVLICEASRQQNHNETTHIDSTGPHGFDLRLLSPRSQPAWLVVAGANGTTTDSVLAVGFFKDKSRTPQIRVIADISPQRPLLTMDNDATDPREDEPSLALDDDDLRRSRSNRQTSTRPPHHHHHHQQHHQVQEDNELLALRCQNLHLHAQVQDLTRQLQSRPPTPQQQQHQEPAAFPLFPRLPPELRRKIWRLAVPAPRTTSVDFVQRSARHRPGFEANQGAPALLGACREAREVGLERYELAFASVRGPVGAGRRRTGRRRTGRRRTAVVGGGGEKGEADDGDDEGEEDEEEDDEDDGENEGPMGGEGFYFDFARDTLCFTRETTPLRIVLFLEDMPAAEVGRVRSLAVGTELPKEVMKYATQFHGLEVFRLILTDPRLVAPRGRFGLAEAAHRSIWVMGAYWDHELTSWGRMEALIREAFDEERLMSGGECSVPRVEFVYAVSAREGCCRDCPGHE